MSCIYCAGTGVPPEQLKQDCREVIAGGYRLVMVADKDLQGQLLGYSIFVAEMPQFAINCQTLQEAVQVFNQLKCQLHKNTKI